MKISPELVQLHCCYSMAHLMNSFWDEDVYDLSKVDLGLQEGKLFVTLNFFNKNTNKKELRGCVGSTSNNDFKSSLEELTESSAFNDFRFKRLTEKELPYLEVTISVLDKFEGNKKWDEWDLGTHGIVMNYKDNSTNRDRSALFLPEVPVEHNMDKKETIKALLEKSGHRFANKNNVQEELDGMLKDVNITRYITVKSSLHYDKFRQIIKDSKYNIRIINNNKTV